MLRAQRESTEMEAQSGYSERKHRVEAPSGSTRESTGDITEEMTKEATESLKSILLSTLLRHRYRIITTHDDN